MFWIRVIFRLLKLGLILFVFVYIMGLLAEPIISIPLPGFLSFLEPIKFLAIWGNRELVNSGFLPRLLGTTTSQIVAVQGPLQTLGQFVVNLFTTPGGWAILLLIVILWLLTGGHRNLGGRVRGALDERNIPVGILVLALIVLLFLYSQGGMPLLISNLIPAGILVIVFVVLAKFLPDIAGWIGEVAGAIVTFLLVGFAGLILVLSALSGAGMSIGFFSALPIPGMNWVVALSREIGSMFSATFILLVTIVIGGILTIRRRLNG